MKARFDARFDAGRPLAADTVQVLGAYRNELLRWNQQINLVSRRNPEAVAEGLIRQCVGAFDRWWDASGAELVGPTATLRVFDLGSGGGLPAFVWLALLKERGVRARATLVEPREKRAWFLERLGRLRGAPEYDVIAARWGEAAITPVAEESAILFTLKALRLSESAILGGLAVAAGAPPPRPGVGIDIVRFQPTEGVTVAGLAAALETPPAGARHGAGFWSFESRGSRLLVPARAAPDASYGASLFVSRHVLLGESG
jgi:hypothetical protein